MNEGKNIHSRITYVHKVKQRELMMRFQDVGIQNKVSDKIVRQTLSCLIDEPT